MVETRGGRRFAVFFLVAAFLVLFLGRWLKPVDQVALTVAAPFQSVISVVASSIGDTVSGIVEGPRLRSENEHLKRQMGELLRRNVILQEQAHENSILRRMVRYQDLNNNIDLLPARVIGNDPNNLAPSIFVNRGRRDGLRSGMTVLDQNGYFVGTITDLTTNQAEVQLLINPSSSVGAMDLGTRAQGVVESQFTGIPQLRYVPTRSVLRAGDFVVTSGQNNLYPRTLAIGQIVKVYHSNEGLLQTADIRPLADFQDLEFVQIVRNFVPQAPTKLLTQP